MNDKITVECFVDPLSQDRIYSTHLPLNYMKRKLNLDIFQELVTEVSNKVSADILQRHGSELTTKLLSKETELCNKITEALNSNLDKLIDILHHFQRDYEAHRLCSCGKIHTSYEKICSPIDNLEYLEKRYEIITNWVKSLKI